MFDTETTSSRLRSVLFFILTERCFVQIYRALYGDAMLIQMGTNMAAVK